MNLAQYVYLDDYYVKCGTVSLMTYISRSSDFLSFFPRLRQSFSNGPIAVLLHAS